MIDQIVEWTMGGFFEPFAKQAGHDDDDDDDDDAYLSLFRDTLGCVSSPSIQGNPVAEKGGLHHIQSYSW